jgi:hypothetical protein
MTTGQEPRSSQDRHPAAAPARGATLILTQLTKLAGLVVAVHEAFTTKDPVVMALAALMIAGGQVSETFVLGLIDRFLGRDR